MEWSGVGMGWGWDGIGREGWYEGGKKRAHFDNGILYGTATLPTKLLHRDLANHRRRITENTGECLVTYV